MTNAKTTSATYADSGVSIDNANETVSKIKEIARGTFNAKTLSDIGSFGGMFDARFPEMESPVLVASADGVGTKLKIAIMANRHDTIGEDLVNHCVNDILVQGARPLFFMDYFATGKLDPEIAASVISGMAKACKENGCVLLGGETAEMPSMYSQGDYDIAGFILGVVDRRRVIDGKSIVAGDVVLGLPSTGLHTNGYSLARDILFAKCNYDVNTALSELSGEKISDLLLKIHRSYLPVLDKLLNTGKIKGLAHITGGGLLENIPRILPEGIAVEVRRGTWNELPIFGVLQKLGNVEDREMFRTFNMGLGMILICSGEDLSFFKNHLGEECREIGKVVAGKKEVFIK
jgi:phosphoribosylformylglycinamidine cyclo-ligase